ncbi:HAD-IIIC family phosphatase [Planctomycetota bacterium]
MLWILITHYGGGVLGEDGVAGLKLGGDYPGNAFRVFQKALKKISERGIALAVCSKNEEAHALEAMTKQPSMVLEPQDFVCHRINWEPKWKNILAMSQEVNLGLDNILFIDDNPSERQMVRLNLPTVKVLELPKDPSYYTQTLLECPWLECVQLTGEDFHRTKSYRNRVKLKSKMATHRNPKEFYAMLKIKLYISSLAEGNLDRALQLINKTNQFNATTRRYDLHALNAFVDSEQGVFVLGEEDKFSEFENIGVLILRWNHPATEQVTIDTYLLSCRALGKGLEEGIVKWVANFAKNCGYHEVIGQIVETERNAPIRSVYRDAGFERGTVPGHWHLNLQNAIDAVPHWLEVHDDVYCSAK